MPHGEAPGSVRRHKKQRESMGKSLYLGFHRKGKVKQGNRLRTGLSEPFQ